MRSDFAALMMGLFRSGAELRRQRRSDDHGGSLRHWRGHGDEFWRFIGGIGRFELRPWRPEHVPLNCITPSSASAVVASVVVGVGVLVAVGGLAPCWGPVAAAAAGRRFVCPVRQSGVRPVGDGLLRAGHARVDGRRHAPNPSPKSSGPTTLFARVRARKMWPRSGRSIHWMRSARCDIDLAPNGAALLQSCWPPRSICSGWMAGGWTAASRLHPGDWLFDPQDHRVQITGIKMINSKTKVYTFKLAGDSAFYANGVLVHDLCGAPPGPVAVQTMKLEVAK